MAWAGGLGDNAIMRLGHGCGRREFLGRSALAAAGAWVFPAVIPARVLGRDGRVAPSEKITLGCIGVGRMGTSNMKNFLALDGCRVVAVCDPYRERREAAKGLVDKANGDTGCAMYGDYRELLAREDIDAVSIAAQDHWHALIATAAAAAGKDLYCEKPLGVSIEEGKAIRGAVRERRRVFQAGTWQRSKGQFLFACELARGGHLGKIQAVEVAAPGPQYQPKYEGPMEPQPVPEGFDWAMWRGPAPEEPYNPGRVAWPDWYLIWDYCAGFICNWGVHHLDIANWGEPRIGSQAFEVECRANYRAKGFTDNVEGWDATFRYADGLTVRFKDAGQQKAGCRFIGENGWVHVDREGGARGKDTPVDPGVRRGLWAEPESLLQTRIPDGGGRLYRSDQHQDDFLKCVRSRKDPVSDVDATHIASYLGLVADIAGRLRRPLKWDPKAERFVGDDEANAMLGRPMHNGWKL